MATIGGREVAQAAVEVLEAFIPDIINQISSSEASTSFELSVELEGTLTRQEIRTIIQQHDLRTTTSPCL